MADESGSDPLLAAWLPKLSTPGGAVQVYQLLQASFSGARVYRLQCERAELVLKLTPRTSQQLAQERAERELRFYQALATALPIRLPRLLQVLDDAEGIALLFASYEPTPPPPLWQPAMFLDLARELASLHAAFWQAAAQLQAHQWLRRRREDAVPRELQEARSHWQALQAQPRYQTVLTEQRFQRILDLLHTSPRLEHVRSSFPLTLCHGDCTTANILRDRDGRYIWIDWQEAGLARGPEDLSFLLQRAAIAGARVPREEAIGAYHEALEAYGVSAPSRRAIEQLVDGAELRSRLLEWPAYLQQASVDDLARMVRQIERLADRLEL